MDNDVIFTSLANYGELEFFHKGDKVVANKGPISAEEAKKLTLESLERLKLQDRDKVFSSIRQNIASGHKNCTVPSVYLMNGNDTFFEGLGYEVEQLPNPEPNTLHGGGMGVGVVFTQYDNYGNAITNNNRYTNHKLSWE